MNKFRVLQAAGVIALLLANPAQSLAHTALTQSTPADGATITSAPENLVLEFTEEVRLLKTTVTTKNGKELEIGFTPVANAAKNFSVALPALTAGEYQVNWTVMGSDGHRMEQNFGFMIDPNTPQAAAMQHGEHTGGHADAHADGHAAHGDTDTVHAAHGATDHAAHGGASH